MKTLYIIPTLDYEVFGNGSGDVFKHILKPTNKLLANCENAGIKLSIFPDFAEVHSFHAEACKGNVDFKNKYEAIINNLTGARIRGHDIHFHMHPQWYGAKYEKTRWTLNPKNWRIHSLVKELSGYDYEVYMNKLMEIYCHILGVDKFPDDTVYRSAYLNTQPYNRFIHILRASGFSYDSSIFPGGIKDSTMAKYDYNDIVSNNGILKFLETNKELKYSSIIEFPIYSYYQQTTFSQLFRRITSHLICKISQLCFPSNTPYPSRNTIERATGYFRKESVPSAWDYCLLDYQAMLKYLDSAVNTAIDNKHNLNVAVMIGHSKEYLFSGSFRKFINYVKEYNSDKIQLQFATFREVIGIMGEENISGDIIVN